MNVPLILDLMINLIQLIKRQEDFLPSEQYLSLILDLIIIFYKIELRFGPEQEFVLFKFNKTLKSIGQIIEGVEQKILPVIPEIIVRVYNPSSDLQEQDEFKHILAQIGVIIFYIKKESARANLISGIRKSPQKRIQGSFDLEYWKTIQRLTKKGKILKNLKIFDIRNQIFGYNLEELNPLNAQQTFEMFQEEGVTLEEKKAKKLTKFYYNSLDLNPDRVDINQKDVFLAKNSTILQIGDNYVQIFNKYGQYCYRFGQSNRVDEAS